MTRLKGAHPAGGRARPAAGLAILLAEDNDINALLARTVLEKAGATVSHARDGADAITKAKNALETGRGFDLVLMDIHMPDMDGMESAARIRALYVAGAEPGDGRPPIVALTANALAEDRAAYLAAGLTTTSRNRLKRGTWRVSSRAGWATASRPGRGRHRR
ncbi:hypothetical protein AUC68_11895 [Methyloceanibacter methanicus]|uniref:Response regulatory domain-containing protein n=1 Tax=Methyloceanibacter methanicus TaxID=1774968 RepID=A0A1E3W5I3_9HYPH|nr:response regulator [Methyloceanibacter methanicus]ODS01078.1 hypothetical protein AUC68_11895 [Methyloceanibacter methanicus]